MTTTATTPASSGNGHMAGPAPAKSPRRSPRHRHVRGDGDADHRGRRNGRRAEGSRRRALLPHVRPRQHAVDRAPGGRHPADPRPERVTRPCAWPTPMRGSPGARRSRTAPAGPVRQTSPAASPSRTGRRAPWLRSPPRCAGWIGSSPSTRSSITRSSSQSVTKWGAEAATGAPGAALHPRGRAAVDLRDARSRLGRHPERRHREAIPGYKEPTPYERPPEMPLTRPAPTAADARQSSMRFARRAGRSSSPATASISRMRTRPCACSPNVSAFPWRPASAARDDPRDAPARAGRRRPLLAQLREPGRERSRRDRRHRDAARRPGDRFVQDHQARGEARPRLGRSRGDRAELPDVAGPRRRRPDVPLDGPRGQRWRERPSGNGTPPTTVRTAETASIGRTAAAERARRDAGSSRGSPSSRRAALARAPRGARPADGTDGRPMRPEAIMAALDELMADDAIVTADTGYASAWAGALLTCGTPAGTSSAPTARSAGRSRARSEPRWRHPTRRSSA